MSTLRQQLDPELMLLRIVVKASEYRELETARFGLYAALETGDLDLAHRWADALRVGLQDNEAALRALDRVDALLATEVRHEED
ncbi:MAG: hypothetical protein QJR02_10280 [Sinobacteraceae bacterium]|nr:hypothetical protein [Nevskiaceae bacterium]